MPNLADLIAEAMTEERRRYTIYRHKTDDARDRLIDLEDDHSILFDGDWKACEAHLERLVLAAALAKHGCVIVPVEPTEASDIGDASVLRFIAKHVPMSDIDRDALSRIAQRLSARAMIAAGETP